MNETSPLLLALHSSSDCLAIGLQGLGEARIATHPLGRALGNDLLACLEDLLPARRWSSITRLSVATGPGGFTSTRLTVVLARTLAQQLELPLDGFSTFLLIARRRWRAGELKQATEPFWIEQVLPRRGLVAGCYQVDPAVPGGLAERAAPRLFPLATAAPGAGQQVRMEARVEPAADLAQLLEVSQAAAASGIAAPWQPVLPLYPTSPVEPA